jgi:hypothetical protein
VKVKQQRHLSLEAAAALKRALPYANFDWAHIERAMSGHGWMIWNIGNLCWVFTIVNEDNEIEVLLTGGTRARECIAPWEAAMKAEPAHRGMVIRVDGRKGWARLLKHWERRGDVLYLRID